MPPQNDVIHLAAACDENYAMPLAAMLGSVAATLGEGLRVRAYVLESALTAATKDKIEESFPPQQIQLSWIAVEPARLAHLKGTLRSFDTVSIASYYRLLLPELLPADLDKTIYLDCDLIVNHNLGELWDLDVSTTSVLAVRELTAAARFVSSRAGIRLHRELGLAPDLEFFNSGVMLINLRRWRDRQISRQAFNYLREAARYLRWHDQEALNAVLAGEWRALDARWNVTMHAWRDNADLENAALSTDPYVVHYNSAIKPWHDGFSLGRRELFFKHLDTTAWSGWRPTRPPHPTLARTTARIVRALRKRLHAVKRIAYQGIFALRSWWALRAPLAELYGRKVPATRRSELRLLVAIDRLAPDLPQLLQQHLATGVDRVLVAFDDTLTGARDAARRVPDRVHLFPIRGGRGSRDLALRRLLHRFGMGHWCLLLDADERFLYPHAPALSLQDLCAQLDANGFDALDCRIGAPAEADQRLRIAFDDPINRKVFVAQVCVAEVRANTRIDELECRSRVALLKYRPGMLIGRDLHAVHEARLADTAGVIQRISIET